MPTEAGHLRDEELQDALDGRLSPPRLAEVEAHLRVCEPCRQSWEALSWTKKQAARAPSLDLPEGLAEEVIRSLDREDASARPAGPKRTLVAGLAAAVAAAVTVAVLVRVRDVDPVRQVARHHAAIRDGSLSLSVQSGDVRRLEDYLSRAGLPFPPRVFDLGMMSYQLVGAHVLEIRGSPRALIVYRGTRGDLLVCEMYHGAVDALPSGGERHDERGIRFAIYREQGMTLVFWPEGDVVCVLAGEGGPEVVLPLAVAKAVPVRPERSG